MEQNTTFISALNRLTTNRLGVQNVESFPIFYSSTFKSHTKVGKGVFESFCREGDFLLYSINSSD